MLLEPAIDLVQRCLVQRLSNLSLAYRRHWCEWVVEEEEDLAV